MRNTLFAAAAMFLAAPAFATDLVVTTAEKGGVTFASFDLVDARDVAGVQFRVKVPGAANFDTSKCVTSLSAGFNASCSVSGDTITVFAFANEKSASINSKHAPIGQISFRGNAKASIAISDAMVSDNDANTTELGTTLTSDR